jgi:hypothetical protein
MQKRGSHVSRSALALVVLAAVALDASVALDLTVADFGGLVNAVQQANAQPPGTSVTISLPSDTVLYMEEQLPPLSGTDVTIKGANSSLDCGGTGCSLCRRGASPPHPPHPR